MKNHNRRRHYRNTTLFVLTLIILAGMLSACEGQNAIVYITYRPLIAFHVFQNVGVGKTSAVGPDTLRTVYKIESIKNEGSEAKPFTFDISKIYVKPNNHFGNSAVASNELLTGVMGYFKPLNYTEEIPAGYIATGGSIRFVIDHDTEFGGQVNAPTLYYEGGGVIMVSDPPNAKSKFCPVVTPLDLEKNLSYNATYTCPII
jgi:hypothetical protein